MSARILQEAKKHEANAKSLSTRNVLAFKFSVNWGDAAEEYQKAATLYKSHNPQHAAKLYLQASKCFKKSGITFFAARNMEMAGGVFKDLKNNDEAVKCYEKAAEFMIEDGKGDRSAEILIKGAKLMQKSLPKKADQISSRDQSTIHTIQRLFERALKSYANYDKYHVAMDAYRSYNAFLVRYKMYDKCIENLKRQIIGYTNLKQMHNVWKSYVSTTVLQLAAETADWIQAEDTLQKQIAENGEYGATTEFDLAQRLIRSFEKEDPQTVKEITKASEFKFLEPEIARVARDLEFRPMKFPKQKSIEKEGVKVEEDKNRQELFGGDTEGEAIDQNDEDSSAVDEHENVPEEGVEENDEPDELDPDNLM